METDLESNSYRLSSDALARAERAAAFYHKNPRAFASEAGRIVCSGAYPHLYEDVAFGVSEAGLMADQLLAFDVPADLIEKEERSRSTLGNFIQARDFLDMNQLNKEHPLGVVTHGWHMQRAVLLAKRALNVPLREIAVNNHDGVRRTVQEKTLYGVYEWMLRGIQPGDTAALQHAEHRFQKFIAKARRPVRRLTK